MVGRGLALLGFGRALAVGAIALQCDLVGAVVAAAGAGGARVASLEEARGSGDVAAFVAEGAVETHGGVEEEGMEEGMEMLRGRGKDGDKEGREGEQGGFVGGEGFGGD